VSTRLQVQYGVRDFAGDGAGEASKALRHQDAVGFALVG
jgi:hypothetical protein